MFVFDGTLKIKKANLLTSSLAQKVSPNYLSQVLSGPNVSEGTNAMVLPKRELLFEHVQDFLDHKYVY